MLGESQMKFLVEFRKILLEILEGTSGDSQIELPLRDCNPSKRTPRGIFEYFLEEPRVECLEISGETRERMPVKSLKEFLSSNS